MGLCVSGHEVRTEKVVHLITFIAGMQLIVSNAHQRKAPFVIGYFMRLLIVQFVVLLYSCSHININEETKKGIRLYENDSITLAISTLTKVISVTDTCATCFLYRGFAYKNKDQYHKAIKDFNSVIDIDSNNVMGYANRASIFYLKNDYKSSLRDFTKAYQLDTSNKILLNPICHMLFATGQEDEACKYYQLLLELGDTTFDYQIKEYCDKKNNR